MAVTAAETRDSHLAARVVKKLHGFQLDLEFDVPSGITVLFGASGAGKTTLLDCIAGLLVPDEGKISAGLALLFDSASGVNVPPQGRQVGYLFQSLALFPHMTVAQNVAYSLVRLTSAERQLRVQEILASLRIAEYANRRPAELSGGERQRVALARALVTNPRLLLLDEPLTALDAATKERLVDDLRRWNERHNIPVLYVTHDRDEVYALAERVLIVQDGRLIAKGLPQDVLHRPARESVAQLTGFENIFAADVVSQHKDLGTMTCRISGTRVDLEVPLTRVQTPLALHVGVRAGDILIATLRPEGLSARNVLEGTVTSLTRRDAVVNTIVDCGVAFQVQLTPGAMQSLALKIGKKVWIVVKTYSCHVLQ